MKFQQLHEEFLDADKYQGYFNKGYLEVFKNPSSKELEECGENCRGTIDKDGNLYVMTMSTLFTHTDLYDFLYKKGYIEEKDDLGYWNYRDSDTIDGIHVQREGNSNTFKLSESHNESKDPHKREQFLNILRKAEEKNPSFEFSQKQIGWENYV